MGHSGHREDTELPQHGPRGAASPHHAAPASPGEHPLLLTILEHPHPPEGLPHTCADCPLDFLNQCTCAVMGTPPVLGQAAVRMDLPEPGSPTVGSSFKETGHILASRGSGGMWGLCARPVAENASRAWPAPLLLQRKTQ